LVGGALNYNLHLIMDKNSIIEKLKAIKPILSEKYGVTELALFGSYSRDEQKPESDIDIMVDFSKRLGMKYFDLAYFIQDAFKDVDVQVVSKGGIKTVYFESIKQDLLYA
jgi:predicted nucleotidyltransferase